MHLLPSDIARLVLGYLKENGLKKTFVAFLQESQDLSEYWRVLNSGQVPMTTVMGHTLKNILEDYAALTLRVQVLSAKLAQHSISLSPENTVTRYVERSDIDAVVESHRKAELSKHKQAMRQKAKRRGEKNSQRNETLPVPVSHEANLSQTVEASRVGEKHQLESHQRDDTSKKSGEGDDLDDDFEFDSLDQLLADTKLHEKLAESINKALKRDQVAASDQLVSPSIPAKKNNTNVNEEEAGCSSHNKEKSQKDTSAVVDDIISMTANEPGLDQLLSLFQFQPAAAPNSSIQLTDGQNKSAPLYLPEIGSKNTDSQSSVADPSTIAGHACLQSSHKEASGEASNSESVFNKNDKHSPPKSLSAVVTHNSSPLSQISEIPQPLSTPKTLSTNSTENHHIENLQTSSISLCENIDKEQSQEGAKDITSIKSTSLGSSTSLSSLSTANEPSSPVKHSTPVQNFRKPRVKRCPKKLFKQGENSNQTHDHKTHLNQERLNVNNNARLKEDAGANIVMDTQEYAEHSHPSQSATRCSPISHNQDPITERSTPSHGMNSPVNPVIKKGNNECDDTSEDIRPSQIPSLSEIQLLSSSSSSISKPNIPISEQLSSIHYPDIDAKTETTSNRQSNCPSHSILAPPQNGMDDDSLSVFSLINKCTAEIIGEGCTPRHDTTQDTVKDELIDDNRKTNDESKCSGHLTTHCTVKSENEPSLEELQGFGSLKGSNEFLVSSEKELKKSKSVENGTLKEQLKEEAPLTPIGSRSFDMPDDDGNENYDSDSSFDNKISTPNAVYVKPVKLNVSSTRERNYQVLDNCLQNILGKIKASSGEAPNDGPVGIQEVNENIDQHIESSNGDEEDNELGSKSMDDGHEEDKANVKLENGQCALEEESNSHEQRIQRFEKPNFREMEGLHNCSATISTPFVTNNIANADNSPRKLLENHMNNKESISMPASFPSSVREEFNVKGHHKPNECCSPFSPSVAKFHSKSKENFSPTMSIPQSSRKVIACNISHSPFIPSHLKRTGPSRRITPTEVSFSTPSPLGLMSPSSPAEFIIDLAQSPRQPNTPVRDSKTNFRGDHVKDSDSFGEKSQIGELTSPSVKCRDEAKDSNSFQQREITQKSETPVPKINDGLPFSAPSDVEPELSNGDISLNRSLPLSPSQRKPRRVIPTLLSKSVSKVGGDSLFSSSSCSQNASVFHQDESKIVSSISDPSSPHSEAEAFRQLKTLICPSYTKPQPNQEIATSNSTKGRHPPTPSRKCGCENRDVCTHVTRHRHSCSPMRKCGCISRDVCTHVKGKGRKLFKKHSGSVSKSKSKDIPLTTDSENLSAVEIIDSELGVDKLEGVISDHSSKDNDFQKIVGTDQTAESSLSSGAFIAVGTVQIDDSDKKMEDPKCLIEQEENNDKGIYQSDTDVVLTETIIPSCREGLNQNVDTSVQQKETDQLEQIVFDKSATPGEILNAKSNCNSNNSTGNSDKNIEKGDSKGNSRSSNESSTAILQNGDFDHHDNISLAAPYFPELSNTFDFFKLKNRNSSESGTEKLDSVIPTDSMKLFCEGDNSVMKSNNVNKISPMPGTSQEAYLPERLEDLQGSTCLISQAMEQCGISFEPSEQTLMELSHFVEMGDGIADHTGNHSVQENVPVGHDPQRMQLRSATRQCNSTKSSNVTKGKKTTQTKAFHQPPLLPNTSSTKSPQPHIILPSQSSSTLLANGSPAPMAPGTVAYFSQPNQAPIPFTILADGRVIVLSDSDNTSPRPPPPPPPPPPPQKTLSTPYPLLAPTPHVNWGPTVIQPVASQASSVTNIQKSVISNINYEYESSPICSSQIKKSDIEHSTASKEKKKGLVSSTDSKEKKKGMVSPTYSKEKKKGMVSPTDSKEKKKGTVSPADSNERKKGTVSSTDSKKKRKYTKKVKERCASDEEDDYVSCVGSRQKIATRRKIKDISSSPRKATVSTYFKRPKKYTKRTKISHASNENSDQSDDVNKDVLKGTNSDTETERNDGHKRRQGKDGKLSSPSKKCPAKEIESMPVIVTDDMDDGQRDRSTMIQDEISVSQPPELNEDETRRACDVIALINGDSPYEAQHSMESFNPQQQADMTLSPSKHGNDSAEVVDRNMIDSEVIHYQEDTKESMDSSESRHVQDKRLNSEDNANGQKERILSSLSLKKKEGKKECNISFSSNAVENKDTENVEEGNTIRGKESAISNCTETTSKEIESSSNEVESGNSIHGRLHSTPVDEAFFDNLESLTGVEDDGEEILNPKTYKSPVLKQTKNIKGKRNDGSIRQLTPQKKSEVSCVEKRNDTSIPSLTPEKKSEVSFAENRNDTFIPSLTPQKKSEVSCAENRNDTFIPSLTPQGKSKLVCAKKTNDTSIPSLTPQKRSEVRCESSQRKSLSEILKSVSLEFTKKFASPRTKPRPLSSSDDEDFDDYTPPIHTSTRRRVRRISNTSTGLSNSFTEEKVESHVSYAKVVKDTNVSITLSDDGDVIKDISDSSISLEKYVKMNIGKEERMDSEGTDVVRVVGRGKPRKEVNLSERYVKKSIGKEECMDSKGDARYKNGDQINVKQNDREQTEILTKQNLSVSASNGGKGVVRGRGRPRKEGANSKGKDVKVVRRRGRPRKEGANSKGKDVRVVRRRGRPRKEGASLSEKYVKKSIGKEERMDSEGTDVGRGRPRKEGVNLSEKYVNESIGKEECTDSKGDARHKNGDQINVKHVDREQMETLTEQNLISLSNGDKDVGRRGRKRKADANLLEEKHKRHRREQSRDDNGFRSPQPTEQEIKETEVCDNVKGSRNLSSDIVSMSKNDQGGNESLVDDKVNGEHMEENGLELLSSVALSDQSLILSDNNKTNLSDTPELSQIDCALVNSKSTGLDSNVSDKPEAVIQTLNTSQMDNAPTYSHSSRLESNVLDKPEAVIQNLNTSQTDNGPVYSHSTRLESNVLDKPEAVIQNLNTSQTDNAPTFSHSSRLESNVLDKPEAVIQNLNTSQIDIGPVYSHSTRLESNVLDKPEAVIPNLNTSQMDNAPIYSHSTRLGSNVLDKPETMIQNLKTSQMDNAPIYSHSTRLDSNVLDKPEAVIQNLNTSQMDNGPIYSHSTRLDSNASDKPEAATQNIKVSQMDSDLVTKSTGPESNVSPHSTRIEGPQPSSIALDSSQNEGRSLLTTPTPLNDKMTSPDASISFSQLASSSASKIISKKKINKLISKLYKTPPESHT